MAAVAVAVLAVHRLGLVVGVCTGAAAVAVAVASLRLMRTASAAMAALVGNTPRPMAELLGLLAAALVVPVP